MTDEERQRLEKVEEQMTQTSAMVSDLHRALLAPAPDGGPSFYQRASVVVTTAERGQWAGKWAVRAVLFLGSILAVFSWGGPK